MKVSVVWNKLKKKIKQRGLKNAITAGVKEVKSEYGGKIFQILLLTNRDSDNVGDQVIEACDVSLLSCIMKNLGTGETAYKINSRPASIVSRAYMRSRKEKLLVSAQEAVQAADIVVFGGAPMFNYLYQDFYERTAITLELAQKYHKPAVFSAIGIERYQKNNPKCQRLKQALNMECVKQITTRDNFEFLQKFKEKESLHIEKVADPAVFSARVFEPYLDKKKKKRKKKRIGIFVLRDNGFKNNKIDFAAEQAADFWVALVKELQARGYAYEILTSGHYSDEAFVDTLIRKWGVSDKKCVFNMNSPEKLANKISSYDAVVSCRLHPSIIAFALDVPSIGIVWNVKVKGFYSSIGYEDRVVEAKDLTPQFVADKLELAMEQGVEKKEEYMMSVYRSLFYALKEQVCPESVAEPYTYEQVLQELPVYPGTTPEEQEEKDRRKYRRIYENYNKRGDKLKEYKENICEKNGEKELPPKVEAGSTDGR